MLFSSMETIFTYVFSLAPNKFKENRPRSSLLNQLFYLENIDLLPLYIYHVLSFRSAQLEHPGGELVSVK